MIDSNTCRRADTFVGATTAVAHLFARIAERNKNCGLYSVAIILVLVALPASAQAVDGDWNGVAMLLAIVLVVGGPALVGLGADGIIRLCIRLRNEAIPLGASIPFVLAHWASRVTKFGRANISTIAVPLIDECKPRGGMIRLVGGDGSYFTGANKEKLRNAMRKWIVDNDMEVQYLLAQPGLGVPEAMREFSKTALQEKGHMLSVFVLEDNANLSGDAKRLADFLATYHPNLVSWPSNDGKSMNRAMWLEGKHLPGEDVSHDNRWIPPSSMADPISGGVDGPTMTWNDAFLQWNRALDELKQEMASR